MRLPALLSLLLALVAPLPAASADALPQSRIRQLYNDGDFDGVIDLIGRFRSRNPTYSREDSIFIAKHLAVVHAAAPQSVGQGKYWMNELLELMPAADLVGMYVSDEIERIFERVRAEFLARQKSFGIDTSTVALPERPVTPLSTARPSPAEDSSRTPPVPSPAMAASEAPLSRDTAPAGAPGSGKRRKGFWIAGGALAAVAAGATTYLVLSQSEDGPREVVIPRRKP